MAIPTMSHSSSGILEVKEASAPVCLAPEALSTSAEGASAPWNHTVNRALAQPVAPLRIGVTTAFTQAEGEQVFSTSVVENYVFRPQLRKRPESSSWTQGATPAPGFPLSMTRGWAGLHATQEAGLGLQRLELRCSSDIYSSNGRSGNTELSSDPESTYIYAESIQGCDSTYSGIPQDWDSLHLCTELGKHSWDVSCDPVSSWNGACKTKRRSVSLDTGSEMVSMKAEASSSFDSPSCSIQAVYGSDYSYNSESVKGNFESASTCTDSGWSFDSHSAEASTDSLYSPVEGSVSSRSTSSCYTAGRGSESPFCTVERHTSSDSEDHFGGGHCDSFVSHFEEGSYDLYNSLTQSSDVGLSSRKEEESVSDSPGFLDCSELAVRQLRGVVTHMSCCHLSSFFCEIVKDVEQGRDKDKLYVSQGFLFHPQKFLQAKNSEYREGREYSLLRHIQNGSYGDVFSVRDKQTGFTCAAKRIPLGSFSWEEVAIWSNLDSPRILQLFGAVREGLNVILFMDLKAGSLAQLLKRRGNLPEDLSLYYLCQVLQALEHLHSRQVLHLDVKVDNVLLSKDGRECFLCDFGLSEMLDQTGCSTKTLRGQGLRGTESHVAPEVARGDRRSDRADVWSSCCMLLHMLTGHQPWTRYYTHPLCLKIVSEPAPLWEIPPGCDPLTCEVIRGGLVKEPTDRDSARELLVKAARALRAVGGFCDPVSTQTPLFLPNTPDSQSWPPSVSVAIPGFISMTTQELLCPVATISTPAALYEEHLSAPRIQWVSPWRERAGEEDEGGSEAWDSDESGMNYSKGWKGKTRDWMEAHWEDGGNLAEMGHKQQTAVEDRRGRSDEEGVGCPADEAERGGDEDDSWVKEESDTEALREMGSDWEKEEWEPFLRTQMLLGSELCNAAPHSKDEFSDTEEESITSDRKSGKMMYLPNTNSKLTLTCHRSTCASEPELTDKDSSWSEDWSSGVFSSCSSLMDEQSFNVDWSVSTNQPPSCCFEGLGVDIWVEDVSGETLKIREKLKVKLGHVAVGISAQISMRTFSLATLDGKLVSPDAEVLESGMWLQCVPAPDDCAAWDWRVRDGKMEMQENDGLQSDTCSTMTA